MAELRICSPDANCPGGDDGRIDRVELDGSAQTIWRQDGDDRALAAIFGDEADEYWLTMDRDGGRQVALVHLRDGREEAVATINRDARWGYVAAAEVAPDRSVVTLWIDDVGGRPAGVLVPLTGASPSVHTGQYTGLVDGAALPAVVSGQPVAPDQTIAPMGEVYDLPPLDELIAAELALNPGRTVLGKASNDAVEGEVETRTFDVPGDRVAVAEVHLDCLGPSSVTVTSGAQSITSPCLRAGSYGLTVDPGGPIIVTASGDTSWRVVVYSP
jgi:hypothetical protein